MISKNGKGSTKKSAIYIPPGQLARGLGQGKGVKTNKVLVDEQESNERINGGIENDTLTLHYGGKQVKDNDFSEDYSYLDILKLCSKFINVNDIGFKITNGDGRKLVNDADVLALLEEHEGVENIELYLELDDSAKPLPFKLPKDASVMTPMTSEKDTTQLGEKDKEYVGNTSQMRCVYGCGGARIGNHGSSSQSNRRGNSAPPFGRGPTDTPHVVPQSASLNSRQIESTQGSTVQPTKVVDDGEPTSKTTIMPCGFEFNPSRVVHTISEIIKARYTKSWLNWKEILEEHKAMWFGEFKKHCSWEKDHHGKILEIWKQKSAQIIRQSLSDIRRGRASGSWLGRDILEDLQKKWKTDPKFLELSKRNKVNSAANEAYQRDVHIPEIIVKLNFDEKTHKWLSPYADNVIRMLYLVVKRLMIQLSF